MSLDHFQDILDFHAKFEVPLAPKHTLLEGEALKFRLDFLQEELDELKKAHEEGNLEDAVDALIDLEVVLLGTSQFMGISKEAYEEHWEEVHRANMSKVRCVDASESKRGTSLDIRKPEGFRSPDHGPIIDKHTM